MNNIQLEQKRRDSFFRTANKKHKNKFDYSNSNYTNIYTKIDIRCPIHGIFTQTPSSHLASRHGCPRCGIVKWNENIRTTKETFLETAKRVHGNRYNYDKVIYTTMTEKVEIGCLKHGSFWQQPVAHSIYGTNCPKCVIENGRTTNEMFINRCIKIHNNKYTYGNTNYTKLTDIIEIECPEHGSFNQLARTHISGSGCIECAKDRTTKTTDAFIKESIEIFGFKYLYDKVNYINNKTPVIITCKRHGDFKKSPQSHLSGSGCPRCIESSGERILSKLLDNFNITYIREYKIKGYRYRFDFYLPDTNIYIEFNGIQHYHPIKRFGGDKALIETKRNDKIKKRLVKDNDGILITISYRHFSKLHTGEYLTQKLKNVYKYWYLIDNKLHVFKDLSDVKDEICLLTKKLF